VRKRSIEGKKGGEAQLKDKWFRKGKSKSEKKGVAIPVGEGLGADGEHLVVHLKGKITAGAVWRKQRDGVRTILGEGRL